MFAKIRRSLGFQSPKTSPPTSLEEAEEAVTAAFTRQPQTLDAAAQLPTHSPDAQLSAVLLSEPEVFSQPTPEPQPLPPEQPSQLAQEVASEPQKEETEEAPRAPQVSQVELPSTPPKLQLDPEQKDLPAHQKLTPTSSDGEFLSAPESPSDFRETEAPAVSPLTQHGDTAQPPIELNSVEPETHILSEQSSHFAAEPSAAEEVDSTTPELPSELPEENVTAVEDNADNAEPEANLEPEAESSLTDNAVLTPNLEPTKSLDLTSPIAFAASPEVSAPQEEEPSHPSEVQEEVNLPREDAHQPPSVAEAITEEIPQEEEQPSADIPPTESSADENSSKENTVPDPVEESTNLPCKDPEMTFGDENLVVEEVKLRPKEEKSTERRSQVCESELLDFDSMLSGCDDETWLTGPLDSSFREEESDIVSWLRDASIALHPKDRQSLINKLDKIAKKSAKKRNSILLDAIDEEGTSRKASPESSQEPEDRRSAASSASPQPLARDPDPSEQRAAALAMSASQLSRLVVSPATPVELSTPDFVRSEAAVLGSPGPRVPQSPQRRLSPDGRHDDDDERDVSPKLDRNPNLHDIQALASMQEEDLKNALERMRRQRTLSLSAEKTHGGLNEQHPSTAPAGMNSQPQYPQTPNRGPAGHTSRTLPRAPPQKPPARVNLAEVRSSGYGPPRTPARGPGAKLSASQPSAGLKPPGGDDGLRTSLPDLAASNDSLRSVSPEAVTATPKSSKLRAPLPRPSGIPTPRSSAIPRPPTAGLRRPKSPGARNGPHAVQRQPDDWNDGCF